MNYKKYSNHSESDEDEHYMKILRSRRPRTDTASKYLTVNRFSATTHTGEPDEKPEEPNHAEDVHLSEVEEEIAGPAPAPEFEPPRGRARNQEFFIKIGSNPYMAFKNKNSAVDYIHEMNKEKKLTKSYILEKLNESEKEQLKPKQVAVNPAGFIYTRDESLYRRAKSVPPIIPKAQIIPKEETEEKTPTRSKKEATSKRHSISPTRQELAKSITENFDKMIEKLRTPVKKTKQPKPKQQPPVTRTKTKNDADTGAGLMSPQEHQQVEEQKEKLAQQFAEYEKKAFDLGLDEKQKQKPLPQRLMRARNPPPSTPSTRGRRTGASQQPPKGK